MIRARQKNENKEIQIRNRNDTNAQVHIKRRRSSQKKFPGVRVDNIQQSTNDITFSSRSPTHQLFAQIRKRRITKRLRQNVR